MKATQQTDPSVEKSAKRNMEAGYQRELNYKHSDGSYSAFGDSDERGSTWLTAFVVKSFGQAKGAIFIDDEIQKKSIQFLKEQQKSNGEFKEDGKVLHAAMQGGSRSGIPLTAFVFIALLHAQERNPRARQFLEQSLSSIGNDPYVLSITTYALHLANSRMKDQAWQMLDKLATQQNGTKFWKDVKLAKEYEEDKPSYWEQPASTDVESTAYALLSLIRRNNMQGAQPVVRWLTHQRNPYGGFTSTQDTVMALQALGAFAEKAYADGMSANVNVMNGQENHQFQVVPSNAIVQQMAPISNAQLPVTFDASGRGMATGQLTVRYNTKRKNANDPFDCSPSVTPKSTNDITVSMCCRHKQPGKTKMAVMEVNALSGYKLDESELQNLKSMKDLKRVELENGNSKANIYFDSLGPNPTCFNVSSSKSFDVANPKPATMALYAYYTPEKRVEMEYSAYSSQPLSVSCPKCFPVNQYRQNAFNSQNNRGNLNRPRFTNRQRLNNQRFRNWRNNNRRSNNFPMRNRRDRQRNAGNQRWG